MMRWRGLVLFVLLLGACQQQPAQPIPKVTQRGAPAGELRVVWKFKPAEIVRTMCPQSAGGVDSTGCAYRDEESCLIIVVEPKDLSDFGQMQVLGEEFWHCTGMLHTSGG